MHTLPTLPYAYNALEPHIDGATMRLHHLKHHQAYIDKLNGALATHPELARQDISELLKDLNAIPEEIRSSVRNHGGGHFNHSFFWTILAPADSAEAKIDYKVETVLDKSFGGMEKFQAQFKQAALGQFGSGWAWLVEKNGQLEITSTANQDSPISVEQAPILGLDVWEHAYYLKYQNRRSDYVDAFFRVINWLEVAKHLTTNH